MTTISSLFMFPVAAALTILLMSPEGKHLTTAGQRMTALGLTYADIMMRKMFGGGISGGTFRV